MPEYFRNIIVTSPEGIYIDSRAYTTLNDAIDAIGANERTIKIASPQNVNTLTIPSNANLEFERDGSIINSGLLTINTKNIKASNRQIFAGTGSINFASGSVIKSAWFSNLESVFNLTSSSEISLIISKPQTITSDCSQGDDVHLVWEGPGNILTTNAGITVSNLKHISVGDYQIFAGAGDFNFLNGTNLNSYWFDDLETAIDFIGTDQVNLKVSRIETLSADRTIDSNTNLDVPKGGMISIDAGVTFTIDGTILAGAYQIFTGDGSAIYNGMGISYGKWWTDGIDTTNYATMPEGIYQPDYSEADQGIIGGGKSAKAYIDIINMDSATLVFRHNSGSATTTYTFSTDVTIPSNIKVEIEKGAILSIASTKTLTINGSFSAGLYQVFSGEGSVSFGSGSIDAVYPQWWPNCLPDGSTDCQPAYVAAIAALPVGGTIHVSQGKWKLSTELACNKQINFRGDGIASVIWLDVGTSAEGIVVGNNTTYITGIKWRDFAILGGDNSCNNALILKKVNGSRFENVHVLAGATGFNVNIQWAVNNYYNFICSINNVYPYAPSAPAIGAIIAATPAGAAEVCNANEFDCIIEGGSGKGLHIVSSGDNGNNYIRGTYEGITGYAIHIKGGSRAHLHDIHSEATAINRNEIVIEDHVHSYVGPAVFSASGGPGYNDVQIINSSDTTINGVDCNRLSIDANSAYTNIVSINFVGQTDNGLYDLSNTTRFYRRTGIAANIASGVATTIFTPSGKSGMWTIMAFIADVGTPYLANARLMWGSAGTARLVSENDGSLTITLSGNNVQVTQTSGIEANVTYIIYRELQAQ